jgi:hypothetical protein
VIGASFEVSFLKPKETPMPKVKLRHGHAPGHVRDAFDAAVEAFVEWKNGSSEPFVDFEINYVPHAIPISRVCAMLWNCNDIIPGLLFDELVGSGLDIKRRTYAACARAIHAEIRTRLRRQAA